LNSNWGNFNNTMLVG